MLSKMQSIIVNLGTLPYYRFFNQNTYTPIVRIAKIVTNEESDQEIVSVLRHWRSRKIHEMHFIQVAVGLNLKDITNTNFWKSAILAGGVIGCLQWNALSNTFWLGPALWYCSLVLSILSMLLSSSQAFIFDSLNVPTEDEGSSGDYRRYLSIILKSRTKEFVGLGEEGSNPRKIKEWSPRWRMVFTWQCPMMFMAYAVCFFLIGLTLFICTALINGEKRTGAAKVRILLLRLQAANPRPRLHTFIL